jgi:isopenicillin N synthase-like dioxygenase
MIPTIDLQGTTAAEEIGDACEHVGFFQIVGHGVPFHIVERAWLQATAFFDLPLSERLSVAMPHASYPYGYQGFEVERLASSLGVVTPPDRKHSFSIGPIDSVDHAITDPDEQWIRSPNQWPGFDPSFRAVMESYYREMGLLCERVLSFMAVALNKRADYFQPFINAHTSALRLLDYPHTAVLAAPGQLRAGAHTDYGTLTILRQDNAPGGLEVQHVDGRWIPVPAVSDAFVVNVGDSLARWTNDRWKSTLHRVVNPPVDPAATTRTSADVSTRRQSIVFFHNANWNAEITAIDTCLGDGEAPKYPPVLAGRHLMSKFVSTVEGGNDGKGSPPILPSTMQ